MVPAITLTAVLDDLAGNPVGSPANPSKLCIALCNFGPQLPRIAGTTLLAKVGPFFIESIDGTISTKLWGNDVIVPVGTYYTVSVLDGQGNVVQCAAYQITGSGSFDLSNLNPILPPYGTTSPAALKYLPCTGSGTAWTAPGMSLVAVAYNGMLLRAGLPPPLLSYTATGTAITLTFTPDPLDKIDALCVV